MKRIGNVNEIKIYKPAKMILILIKIELFNNEKLKIIFPSSINTLT